MAAASGVALVTGFGLGRVTAPETVVEHKKVVPAKVDPDDEKDTASIAPAAVSNDKPRTAGGHASTFGIRSE